MLWYALLGNTVKTGKRVQKGSDGIKARMGTKVRMETEYLRTYEAVLAPKGEQNAKNENPPCSSQKIQSYCYR